mmetsp:Transcript_19197/g.41715  ORF Transcript_19197/g.41715 Transcript_19197/m.41715 type:complete len:542 (+) Transcript_19197:188-1813(+)|eukprot:CAMPEP_0168204052 /NCGR_PEP_ID=MMETSP0139_2-20121125/25190_1 /TAXON_ID=44445 /ORGANISM="Pseudo-nitzschia australis, Strain 10249 10 AB" /LENGTH=541 /DNA_ID=CAMNT_0008129961 /DNA_START=78 /DNA_END=1703 /DNA_ORIENTATION=-
MIGLKSWLSFAAVTCSTAFVPNTLLPAHDARRLHRLAAESAGEGPPQPLIREVFSGVHLPEGKSPPAIVDMAVEGRVLKFIGTAFQAGILQNLIGKPKSEGLGPLQKTFIETNLKTYTVPDDPDYEPFGTGKYSKILTHLLKTDPFIASALKKTRRGFELRSFNRRDPLCETSTSLYTNVMNTMTGAGHRVNFYFDPNMKMTNYRVYDDATGHKIHYGEQDVELWASSALYNVLVYSSSVHATIHALHYLMTSAFQYVSEDFEEMHQWANFYANNVQQKYSQVGDKLIRPPVEINDPDAAAKVQAVVSGKLGFGSTDAIRPILADVLNTWGQNPTASDWLDSVMGVSLEDMADAKICTEFMKHADLVSPFAKEVAGAFREIDAEKASAVETSLKEYLKDCGSFTSNIDTLENWIELMAITGDFHGSTVGYTRLGGMGDIMKWRDIRDPKWTAIDAVLCATLLGTVCGMDEGRYTTTSTCEAPYGADLQAVLDKYDAMSTELKKEYEAEIQKHPDFSDYGWILSEFCTDGFDGKQLTTATYI